MKLQVTLKFRSYIAHPFWSESNDLVNIQKQSGMNRARSEDKKDAALRKYLDKIGMTIEEYQALERKAQEQWYRTSDGTIFIPRHQLSGALVHACKSAPAGCRYDANNLRCLVQISDFLTTKQKCDSVFTRFVLPTDGKGNPLSNQRRLTKNEVLEDFTAVGTFTFDATDVKKQSLLDLVSYAGKHAGCGASRKMGHGRFQCESHKEI